MRNILLIGLSFEVSTVDIQHVVVTETADERRAMSASCVIRLMTSAGYGGIFDRVASHRLN